VFSDSPLKGVSLLIINRLDMKRTKIVCTIGPASNSKAVLKRMVKAGMDCARLNFSHGTYQEHSVIIKFVRQVAKEIDRPVAFIADLQGPRVRIGELPNKGVKLKRGGSVILSTQSVEMIDDRIPVTYRNLHQDVKKNDTLLVDEGLINLKVQNVAGRNITCKVIIGGVLTSHKGINAPTATLNIPLITNKDKKDLEFAIKNDIDWVAVSFVKDKEDIRRVRRLIKKLEDQYRVKHSTKIIAKIEKHEAVKNFDEILSEADGIMVARGDLGIETPIKRVPLVQKVIIEKCLAAAKPVITATQMLLAMVDSPRPTRAEVSDVANAVIDHTDAVMLSQESAVGKYPVAVVKTMASIIKDTEESPYDDIILQNYQGQTVPIDTAISLAASTLARDIKAKAILVATISGYTARIVSGHRPELPIVVAAESEKVRRQLAMSWGVIPYVVPRCKNVDELINKTVTCAKKKKIVKVGDRVIIIGGQPVGRTGNVNLVKIHEVK